jgi:hypothetical protein
MRWIAVLSAIIAIILIGILIIAFVRKRIGRGRVLHEVPISTVMKSSASTQATKIPAPFTDAKQLVVRRVNWKDEKELSEQEAARNLCNFTGRETWQVEPWEQKDKVVDIRATSPDGRMTDDFKIVRVWDQVAWKELNTRGAADRSYDDQGAIDLLRTVLNSKGTRKYPADVRATLTLVVDANPIASPSRFVEGIESAIRPYAQLGYKAVWLVGTADSSKID